VAGARAAAEGPAWGVTGVGQRADHAVAARERDVAVLHVEALHRRRAQFAGRADVDPVLSHGDGSSRRDASTSYWSVIFSDLPWPAEASSRMPNHATGFAQAEDRYPLFGITLYEMRIEAAVPGANGVGSTSTTPRSTRTR